MDEARALSEDQPAPIKVARELAHRRCAVCLRPEDTDHALHVLGPVATWTPRRALDVAREAIGMAMRDGQFSDLEMFPTEELRWAIAIRQARLAHWVEDQGLARRAS